MRWLVLALALSLSACAHNTLYEWGGYEESLYAMYHEPGGQAQVAADLEQLSGELAETIESGARVPPGLHAHLGYLHALNGELDAADQHFKLEKAAFPESATFIDGIVGRMGR